MTVKTKTIGMLGELAVCKHLISLGYEVFQEVGDDSKIDLLTHRDGKYCRVQVKTVSDSSDNTVGIPRCKTTNHKRIYYTKDQIDVVAVYVIDRDILLFAAIEELGLGTKRGITARFVPPKSGVKHYLKVEDYLSFEKASNYAG